MSRRVLAALALRCAFVLLVADLLPSPVLAQGPTPAIRLAVTVIPPTVIEQHGKLTGFTIDVWSAVAAQMKVKTDYLIVPDTATLNDCLQTGQCDLAMPQFITWERDQAFDFSTPVLTAGQRILVRDTGASTAASPILALLRLLSSTTTMIWLATGLLLVLVPAHIAWFLDRGREDGVIPSKKYFPGIFQAIYWAATTLLTQAEESPRQWLARLTAVLLMFVGLVFVAFYTAQLTTDLTVQQIKGTINGPDDLPGRQIATIGGSISVAWLRNRGARVQEYQQPAEMYAALLSGKADAVVFAGPVLLYYANHEGKGRVKVVGPEINRSDIAFVYPVNSPLRRTVDSALLQLQENGTYDAIYKRWFGEE
ncbi:transporter substrate-binding domain-containing protein [Paraburkholderia silviterrae]|uniref:Transporter substrate-binding domain-containing protein n=1 Tax=Paraburkholderia silviterrae TaxID=2528715 RepID=A0A4V2ZXV3_9BURK|nr:transporter substrate-binding domain-containing protein [Paraburkholderia silviterrae]TDG17272.1 transporter substrate-binding domain-containing protein [Paraburkholderia silviterrae]